MKKINKAKILKIVLLTFIYFFLTLLINERNAEAEELINDGIYTIKSAVNSDYVLDVTGASDKNLANIELWTNNNGTNQKYYIKNIGNGYYTLSNVNSGKYLDVEGASKLNGANVLQYQFNGGDNQKWIIQSAGNGYYYIISKCNGLYLDVVEGIAKNGTNVVTWKKNGGANQKFLLEAEKSNVIQDGIYKISSALNEKYVLDVTGASSSNLANIELWGDNNANNQKFKVKSSNNGYYTISAINSEKYLDVENASKLNGANVLQYDFNGGDNQKWIMYSAGDGYYYIVSMCNNLFLDVEGANAKNGTNILMWQFNGGLNQKFKLTPTVENKDEKSEDFKLQHPDIKVGIDVSKYQGNIDWQAVKNDGIDFVMVRVGFRGYGESGSLNEDSRFRENIIGAKKAGLDVGVYFFSQATNRQEGIKEAEYTINLIKTYNINYPVAYDTEFSSSPSQEGRADNISVQARTEATKGFCETIKKSGYNVLIYASSWWLENQIDLSMLSEYKIWLANYTGATQDNPLNKPSKYKGDYVMWQYTDCGKVNGISNNVDCDIYYYKR